MELIPSLPEEIGLECLIRLPHTSHRAASRVCHQWRDLLQSRDFYYQRKRQGKTRNLACLVYSLPCSAEVEIVEAKQQSGLPPCEYGIALFDPVGSTWEKLDPIQEYPTELPVFSQLTGVEGKLVVMGGWDPVSWEPVTRVFVFDFVTRRWKQGRDMPSKRSFFAAVGVGNCIYIAGGHDESKNALKTSLMYDIDTEEWSELGEMSEVRDECEGVLVGNEFWVVSGYATESQGRFEPSVEKLELSGAGNNRWKRVEGVKWVENRCPRGCVGVGRNGKLMSWGELDGRVKVGFWAVELGESTLATGSAYEGDPQGFFLIDTRGKDGGMKLEVLNVPEEFSGFVQSGCCVQV